MPETPAARLGSRFALEGRTAVVTGASRGIGAAIAQGFSEVGVRVFGLSRTGTAPPGVDAIACDLADPGAIELAFAQIERSAGRLDVLINAAGISLPPPQGGSAAEIARFRATLEIDLVAVYSLILAARPLMLKAGGGSIINLTSINSTRGFPGNPGYVAAKAGLAGMTRALAVDLASDGIRVNALAPGYVRTAMTEASHANPEMHEHRRRQTILGRWGAPDDMIGAALFLASDASAYVTGQELYVDGGWTVKGLVS